MSSITAVPAHNDSGTLRAALPHIAPFLGILALAIILPFVHTLLITSIVVVSIVVIAIIVVPMITVLVVSAAVLHAFLRLCPDKRRYSEGGE